MNRYVCLFCLTGFLDSLFLSEALQPTLILDKEIHMNNAIFYSKDMFIVNISTSFIYGYDS